jgi:hypothetical protein
LATGKRKTMERDQTVMDSRKEKCAGEEDDETNLGVEMKPEMSEVARKARRTIAGSSPERKL